MSVYLGSFLVEIWSRKVQYKVCTQIDKIDKRHSREKKCSLDLIKVQAFN